MDAATSLPVDSLAADSARRLRLERLIGTDETKGARGDLARLLRAKELGHTTDSGGKPIDVAIATLEKVLATWRLAVA